MLSIFIKIKRSRPFLNKNNFWENVILIMTLKDDPNYIKKVKRGHLEHFIGHIEQKRPRFTTKSLLLTKIIKLVNYTKSKNKKLIK